MKPISLFLALLLTAVPLSSCQCSVPTSGEKVGQIVKVETQGVVCPTIEAELIRGGFTNGSGVGGAPFHFTIDNEELRLQAEKALLNNTEVLVKYDRPIVSTKCSTASQGFFATSITELKKETSAPK